MMLFHYTTGVVTTRKITTPVVFLIKALVVLNTSKNILKTPLEESVSSAYMPLC